MKTCGIYIVVALLLIVLEMVFDHLGRDTDDMLSLPVLDQIERLQRRDDIVRLDGRHVADVLDGKIALVLSQNLQEHASPVTSETQQTKIRERLFWRSDFAFLFRELIR